MTLRAVILDFDGTLVESVGIKDGAIEALFADRPELPQIMQFHLANNHMIRYEKLRRIVEDILHEEYPPQVEETLLRRFSLAVAGQIAQAPEVPGTTELLGSLYSAGVPAYLVSMSPALELNSILNARGLSDQFAGVYPYPWTKADAVADILADDRIDPADAVMIGDAPEDAEVADAAGIRFLGRDSGKAMPAGVALYPDMVGVLSALELPEED